MRAVLTGPFQRRTWQETLYCLIGFPLAVVGFVFVVALDSLSAGLAVTFVGLPLLGLTIAACRGWGAAYRGLGRGLLDTDVPAPGPRKRTGGLLRYLSDVAGWRAMLFLLLRFPLGILDFVVAVTFWAYGVGGLTYAIWRLVLPAQTVHGVAHRGINSGTTYYLDTPYRILLTTLAGLLLLLLAPWMVRAVVSLDRLLIRGLLGPTTAEARVQRLEETRAMAVQDSATSLRRIERDLHDGAQARLVALAMSLGLAKEELAGDDPQAAVERIRPLIDAAHREAKGTIIDLRDLARGIHPPALDEGLESALTTLAARSPVPVSLHVGLPERPSQSIETMVYFCTAELLTNVTKHSGARHATVSVVRGEHRLVLRVEDDGAGGAVVGVRGSSGLAGLADRVATVDGRMHVESPDGGPTTVTIEVPV